jgi:hypothetical protein
MAKRKETPAQIAAKLLERKRQDFEAVNLPGNAAELDSAANIEVTRAGGGREGRTVEGDSARRLDAIEAIRPLLRKRECGGCYDALRRLEYDMIQRRGEGDRGRVLERVDGDGGKDIADKILQAGQRIDGLKVRLSRRDWTLVKELVSATQAWGSWRALVFHVTGEENDHAQAGALRSACANLRDAYEDIEQAEQKRAA